MPHRSAGQTRPAHYGFLLTGQVAVHLPSLARFEAIAWHLAEWGITIDRKQLEDAYNRSRVLSQEQYSGLIRLLETFGLQLSAMSNQMMVQDAETGCQPANRVSRFDRSTSAYPGS
jgi:hypothetical protein